MPKIYTYIKLLSYITTIYYLKIKIIPLTKFLNLQILLFIISINKLKHIYVYMYIYILAYHYNIYLLTLV